MLTPTRELANQVTEAAVKYGKHMRFRIGSIVGGVSYQPQMRLLSQPLDILVATPGRLLDHMESGRIDYSRLEVLVLDEGRSHARHGLHPPGREKSPPPPATRQTLFFSATLEGNIAKLAARLSEKPQAHPGCERAGTPRADRQRLHHVNDGEHKHRLLMHVLGDSNPWKGPGLHRHQARRRPAGQKAVRTGASGAALHGNLNQNQRNRAIAKLRTGEVQLLVATDVAARGIDVSGISHVINYDLPKVPEDDVHRIGRTGRVRRQGIAISFAAPEDRGQLRDIERYTRQPIQAHVIAGLEPAHARSPRRAMAVPTTAHPAISRGTGMCRFPGAEGC